MRAYLRLAMLVALFALSSGSAYALDPVLMFLLSAAREVASQAAKRSAEAQPAPEPLRSDNYAGTTVAPAQLRHLVDECFGYLSQAQRDEVFDSLNTALLDPKNAAVRGAMIDYFVARAVAVREAQRQLAEMDEAARARLVAEFKGAVATMPAGEAAKLEEILRKGVLPVPADLNSRLLAALAER